MLKTATSVEQIAQEVGEYLSRYIKVDKIILFGSYAYGNPRPDSDYDLAVISEDFREMNILAKMDLLAKTALAVDSRVELLGFTSAEFSNPQTTSLLEVIKKRGKVLSPA